MKIAVVGPSPIPYTIGGAENLMWGLCDQINQLTEHQAELIKVPVRENNFWNLIDSYYQFYKMDLSHFDMIITSKYPSWMVRHDNSVCWMMHTLRGLYDTYHLMNLPDMVDSENDEINWILDYMKKNPMPDSLDDFFALLWMIKENGNIPEHYFAFPGPFIKKIVHYMDSFGLSGQKRYYAISDTVKEREDYFPVGVSVKTVYPPTVMRSCSTGKYDYIFMISRLDGPKRIDMLIRAMKHVKSDIRLLIAGTGPERERLEALASGDERIQFLGFVRDEEVESYYANCLAVPYFPYDEDYGYITVEAMLHKKPVITTKDAGGPTEFVVDGETGFVTDFEEQAIADRIDFFAKYPEEAKRQGENGYAVVKQITWDKTVKQLLSADAAVDEIAVTLLENEPEDKSPKRKKIVVTSSFSVYPPLGGGQARIFNLYKELAKDYDVEIVAFDGMDKTAARTMIAPHLIENKIPKSAEQQREESRMESRVGIPITDIAMIALSGLTPNYGKALKKAIEESFMVVISHPYLYPEAKKYLGNRKFIYEAHNVESLMKKGMLPQNTCAESLVEQVFEVEKECCERSEFIMTCSQEDVETLHKLYGVPKEKMIVVPNGVDSAATQFTSVSERLQMKRKLGLEREKTGLFMGSWHQPNLDACEAIFKIAEKCPDVKFLLMGSQCLYFRGRAIPDNVGMLGLVSEEEKNRVFSAVDFALNPMMSGSGTNLKMFDYMSAGIPVITTEFGTRGIDDKSQFIISEVDEMAETASAFELGDHAERVETARKYVEDTFDWSVIAKTLLNHLE